MDSITPSQPGDAALAARLQRVSLYLRRRWWIPALLLVIAATAQATYLWLQPPGYTAVGRMWVGGKVRLPESSFFSEEWQNFFGTQIELMQGEKIRRRAFASTRARNSGTNPAPPRVDVSQPRKTTVFNLTVRGSDPSYIEAYVNAVMDEYLKYKREVRASSSDDTAASLAEQVEKVERELNAEEERMADLKRTNNITVLRETSVSAGNQLHKLNLQLADLKLDSELLALVSPDDQLEKRAANASASRLLNDPALTASTPPADYFTVRQLRDLKKLEHKELGEDLRPEHPTMVKLGEEISRIESLLEIYRQQSKEQLETERERLRLKIKAVEDAIQSWEPRVVEANLTLSEYDRKKANLERLQSMYNRLLQARHNVDVNRSVDQESVTIMDRAGVMPTPQRLPLKTALAATIGLIVGFGIVLVLERSDQRMHTPFELRLTVQSRLMGCIPEIKSKEELPLLARDDTRHTFAESFRNLRASLLGMLRNGNGNTQTILVTSAVPGEGKSTVAVNLAMALAFSGIRVLLVDGDLRRGALNKQLGVSSEKGIGDFLKGGAPLEAYLQTAATPNLLFLATGELSAEGGELLARGRFDELLAIARKQFDCVLIDGSPVLAAADSCTMGPRVDGALFVVRADSTPAVLVRQAVEALREQNTVVLGAVFNRVSASPRHYPFYRYRGYQPPALKSLAYVPQSEGALN